MAGWLPLAAVASLPAGSFSMDFKNGVYQVGSTMYTLAQTIDRTTQVTPGVGLVIPDDDTAVAVVQILGAFLSRLIQGNFTLIFSVIGGSTTHNGNSVFFNIQDNALDSYLQFFTKNGAGEYNVECDDYDTTNVIFPNTVRTLGLHLETTAHKLGVTRGTAITVPLALAVDGTLEDWFDPPSPVPTMPWTKACFGGDYTNGVSACRNGITIESLVCMNAVALAALAPLTA